MDHPLKGDWVGHRRLHIQGDWVLIYQINEGALVLKECRTGTHSELFKETKNIKRRKIMTLKEAKSIVQKAGYSIIRESDRPVKVESNGKYLIKAYSDGDEFFVGLWDKKGNRYPLTVSEIPNMKEVEMELFGINDWLNIAFEKYGNRYTYEEGDYEDYIDEYGIV